MDRGSVNFEKPLTQPIENLDELEEGEEELLLASGEIKTPDVHANAGVPSSIFNLANTILGSGTLAMPFACLVSGMGVFAILLIIAGIMAHYSIIMLMRTVDHIGISESRHLGYPLLGLRSYGHRGKALASWSVTLQQIGACIGYIVIIGDVFSPILGDLLQSQLICDRWLLQISIVVLVIFPLCMLRTMDALKYTSLAALAFIIMFALVVFGNGIYVGVNPDEREVLYEALTSATQFCKSAGKSEPIPPPGSEYRFFPSDVRFLRAIPIMSFAFLCHQNSFPIYKELKGRSVAKMESISKASILLCAVSYGVVGISGYSQFLDSTLSDLIKNYTFRGTYISVFADVVRIGFGISLVFSYPIVVWEARENIREIVYGNDTPYSLKRHVCLNLAIITCTSIVGIVVQDIEMVLGLVGATCSPMMVYVLPPLFFLNSGAAVANGPRHVLAAKVMMYTGAVLIPGCVVVWCLNVAKVLP